MKDELFQSGIFTEDSDIRAHVGVANRLVYVFQTKEGRKAIEEHDPPIRRAKQDGVTFDTGEGWLVRLEWINGLRRIRPEKWPGWGDLEKAKDTSEKGRLAVDCVTYCMRNGKFPFWVDGHDDERATVQIKGTDVVIYHRHKVQVKCDFLAGPKPKGSGNLFLQKAERNPLKKH